MHNIHPWSDWVNCVVGVALGALASILIAQWEYRIATSLKIPS